MVRPLFLLAMALGSVWITAASVPYFFGDDLHPFVLEKLLEADLPSEATWMVALKVHVVAAILALPACLVLTLRTVQRRFPRVHRWLGRLTGIVVLIALVPSGSYLALWAKGGAPSTAGFLVSGAIAAIAMVHGIRAARARDFVAHRRATAHVLAQLSVAVTSRALLMVFDSIGIEPEPAYVTALWAPVIASALVAHRLTTTSWRNHEVIRLRALVRDPGR